MGFLAQTWTLTRKNLMIVLVRHWFYTSIRALWAPIIFMFFISYAKNLFVPPANFGIGEPTSIRSFGNALGASRRSTVVFVNNRNTGGEIQDLINQLAEPVRTAGKRVEIVESEDALLTICKSSLRGVSPCYGAASFLSSPSEGEGGIWNYTLRADGSLGTSVYVDQEDNDLQVYLIPFQHAIDSAIASRNNTSSSSYVEEYPFTNRSPKERQDNIRRLYMGTLIDILAVAFFIGVVGVTYQLTGHMATERELGMSQLIEAMTPNKHVWQTQAARLIANHLAFDIIYLPGWIIMSLIVRGLVFPHTSVAIILIYFVLSGLALSSFSILGGALFHKAQLSGITLVIATILLAIIAQVTGASSSGAVAVMSLLFPPMNYVFFIIFCARWERKNMGANLVEGAPESPWQLPGITLWVFTIIQIFLFPVLGALVERTLYGTGTSSRSLSSVAPSSTESVRLTNFSKHYVPGWWSQKIGPLFGRERKETVLAVNELSFSALRGQILVLLGANGSGKSTTLDGISGLNKITSGSIDIDGTGGLGLCPQKNVLWDDLTVFEHVQIFNRLKSTGKRDSKDEIKTLIRHCDLELKTSAKSGTLSGGQKRKLQLAMMFTGGSRVCCVDEVSSGLDPLSRRKIWDILLAERGVRTLLLTTHFLDEADILSDQIVILSKGRLKAEGSAVELKHTHGGGYRVHLYHDQSRKHISGLSNYPHKAFFDQIVYQLVDSAEASRFILKLEEAGVRDYQVNGPTIEDVFLKLAEEIKEEREVSKKTGTIVLSSGNEKIVDAERTISKMSSQEDIPHHETGLSTGKGTGMLQQTWILFRKRITILRRNNLPYFAAFIIPVIAAGLVTFFIKGFNGITCDPRGSTNNPDFRSFQLFGSERELVIPIGPPDRVSPGDLAEQFQIDEGVFRVVDTIDDFTEYVRTNYRNVTPGGFFLRNGAPTFAYKANEEVFYTVFAQNMLNNALYNTTISTQFQEFAVPFAPDAGKTLQMILYFGLAMCAFPGFFALYPTVERLRQVRPLHYSNGIRAAPLWLAYLLFDFVFVLAISALTVIIFVAVSSVWYYPGYLFVVFFLYGLASILLVYVVSLFSRSQLAAFAVAAGGQASLFLLYFIAYMCIITYAPTDEIDNYVTIAHFTIALITPAGNLLRALLLTLNEFSLLCRDTQIASYPGAIKVYGGPIVYLIVQSFLLFGVLVWWDSGYKPPFLTRTKHREEHVEEFDISDPDILAETRRVRDSDDGLRALHLTKSFGSNPAVQNISFGVRAGEVFALLGPNGAGKSTTISVIRGDIRPSSNGGDVLIEGKSILKRRAAARQSLGVCPQFDAMDTMTVLEHLRFYARARGVPDVEHNVSAVVQAVGLEPFKDRMAAALSGGNKRKLSLGIALMGNPSVLLLDEPSSGMDAAAKRVMWRTLSSLTSGRSLLITTHSMEEADALADRAGIMAKRMLALGTSNALRKKYGDAWHVHLVHRTAPHTSLEDMQTMKAWVERNIPGAVVEDRMFHGQLRFKVPTSGFVVDEKTATSSTTESSKSVSTPEQLEVIEQHKAQTGIASLFTLLETHKDELGCEYYSVSQTTLDQVFLTIVGKHNIEEENAREEKREGKGWMSRFTKKGIEGLSWFHSKRGMGRRR
ncbi:ATP-binding cassette sub-family A member 7 [Patellaria atrata CBS 101060]|uniref:ATP-binding cassette sub-family A member 7 n=1 Tax=Patellaria atrata CBS 101060 TaxID=1346257 RepID=A0A9P4VUZ1_9PEZI|nr:ATP-binding cassette sub-family A member 7 [Patellaria atrata CBS 101060]